MSEPRYYVDESGSVRDSAWDTSATERDSEMSEVEIVERLNGLGTWVSDLQTGLYINCVYCGHRYEPGTPGTRSEVLYEHIRICPEHPLSKAQRLNAELRQQLDDEAWWRASDRGQLRQFEAADHWRLVLYASDAEFTGSRGAVLRAAREASK